MAIVNLTPDSFSGDGVASGGVEGGIAAAVAAVDGGADIVDLGAESTRPGAEPLTEGQEQVRLLPVVEGLLKARPGAIVSVDTYHASTARAAAMAGAEIINDVSGLLWDEAMAEAVASSRGGLVLMHTRGNPKDWRHQPALKPSEVLPLVMRGLREQLVFAHAAGVAMQSIVVDPGFGFGKLGGENFVLLAGLERLHELKYPLLVGLSRKGFLGEAVRGLQAEVLPVAEARLTASVAGNVAAVLKGAHVLRVHDLQAAREAAIVGDAVLASGTAECRG
jgi:dihydropteroate synthase